MGNLQRFVEIGDRSGVEIIWTCCVTCLGHLTALSHLISQREPTLRSSMNGLCDLTLNKLGALSREVHVEVHSYFDVLTGVRIFVTFLRIFQALRAFIRSLGTGRWAPSTCASDCARTPRANRCGIGEGLLGRCTLISKQIFRGPDRPQSCRQPCWWMLAQRTRTSQIYCRTRHENDTVFDVEWHHIVRFLAGAGHLCGCSTVRRVISIFL